MPSLLDISVWISCWLVKLNLLQIELYLFFIPKYIPLSGHCFLVNGNIIHTVPLIEASESSLISLTFYIPSVTLVSFSSEIAPKFISSLQRTLPQSLPPLSVVSFLNQINAKQEKITLLYTI